MLGVELGQEEAAELEEHRGEEEPVGSAEDEGGSMERSPVAEDVERELEKEEGAEDDIDGIEEAQERRFGRLYEFGFEDAGNKVHEDCSGYNVSYVAVVV